MRISLQFLMHKPKINIVVLAMVLFFQTSVVLALNDFPPLDNGKFDDRYKSVKDICT